ncbi:ferredoxin [Mumia quercus]|uniref:ferredoxin n=1 Tax=Mumia quercus TaxID=2976125 RepID=UPI0021CF4A0E|nr:ferredoxin [Mumia quercus]
MLTITVDLNTCDNHGQCVFAAPDVFAFNDDEELTFVARPAAEYRDAVLAGAGACPVKAITVVQSGA